jgi:hypothetical protein
VSLLATTEETMHASLVTSILALALTAPTGAAPAPDLDLVFVLDATGSMSAEIREVKERVRHLASALAAGRPGARVRLGVVAFRDRGDAFVTRVFPLSSDAAAVFGFLGGLEAGGGGDGPEDVLAALGAALHAMDWSPGDGTERQLFLVGDAPPHLDYPDGPRVEDLVREARERRIVLNAIGCRSLAAAGVEFFRELAYATEGVYHHVGGIDAAATGDPAGVAGAVQASLDGRRPAAEWTPIEATWVDGPTGGGTRVIAVDALADGAGEMCRLLVGLPSGLQLTRDPTFGYDGSGLRVRLLLGSGPGEGRTYLLRRCLPAATLIHLELEVE